MNLRQRHLFPAIYIVLALPLVVHSELRVKLATVLLCCVGALTINFRIASRFLMLLFTALLTLAPLLLLVQGAACWSSNSQILAELSNCAARRLPILLDVGLLSSALLLIIANEWRGALLLTMNGMYLPRNVRLIAVVSGAMIGEFRRAVSRVHQAFTGRGQAMPAVSWRNAVVLPRMLAVVWAAVLTSAGLRLEEQWSSDGFWAHYVPETGASIGRLTGWDIAVLCGCALVTVFTLANKFL